MTSDESSERPSYAELAAVILAGALHVLTELLATERVALAVSAAISIGFAAYLVFRATREPSILHAWGMRRDNFWYALRAQSAFVVLGGVGLIAIGFTVAVPPQPPATFWLTLALYPVWGTAQQFALQNLIARNLTGLLTRPLAIAVAASVLFGLSHYPRIDLLVLTLLAGVFFTLIYRARPNLWAVGLAHGVLGTIAVYFVVGEDPGAIILNAVTGS